MIGFYTHIYVDTYGVSQSSIVTWIAHAEKTLFEGTGKQLADKPRKETSDVTTVQVQETIYK